MPAADGICASQQDALQDGGSHLLRKQLSDGKRLLQTAFDDLEDSMIKLKRSMRDQDVARQEVAKAEQQAAREKVNQLDRQMREAQAAAHERLDLFPELRLMIASSVPVELSSIYCERSLDQCAKAEPQQLP